jgi:hypothetical protein
MNYKNLQLAYGITLGAIAFAVAFVLGTPLNIMIGPMMGGILNAVVTAMIIAIGCKGVERFPNAIVIWITFSIPAIFTTTMGPPGPHKLLIALITGISMEVIFRIFGRKDWSYALAGGVMGALMTSLVLLFMIALNLGTQTAIDSLSSKLLFVLPIYFILSAIGMYMGSKIFDKRIRDLDVVSRIRGSLRK